MRRLWPHFGFVIAAVLVLTACGQKGIYTKGYYRGTGKAKVVQAKVDKKPTGYHVVQASETLYSIAWQYGYDYRQLAYWNGIKPPYTIFPKQRLRITPPPALRATSPQYVSRPKTAASKGRDRNKATRASKYAKPKPAARRGRIVWRWPARGRIVSTFSANDSGRKGVDIAGRLGQPIHAAAAGRVVYSGSGLRGYGDLIIIKHNDTFFSAYAHNKKILVRENQEVKLGQRIADMGKSGTNSVKLHFEVRRNGKPVNPLRYLPKQRS